MGLIKEVKGFEGIYNVTEEGQIISVKKGRALKGGLNTKGYLQVGLRKDNKTFYRLVHKIVAEAFIDKEQDKCRIVVDHINNIKTDNRLENLQVITARENTSKDRKKGSSKYVGVCLDKRSNRWRADIRINGKKKTLGYFKKELDAANAYKEALKIT